MREQKKIEWLCSFIFSLEGQKRKKLREKRKVILTFMEIPIPKIVAAAGLILK